MPFTKQENTNPLAKKIQLQIKSLFIGAVINETNLDDYSSIKELIGYNKGYTANQLGVMQLHINMLKYDFPSLYRAFRAELLFQIQGREISSIFTICDRYINSFSELKYFDYKDFYASLNSFSRRAIL